MSFRRKEGYCRNKHIYEDSLYKAIEKAWTYFHEVYVDAVNECICIAREVAEVSIPAVPTIFSSLWADIQPVSVVSSDAVLSPPAPFLLPCEE